MTNEDQTPLLPPTAHADEGAAAKPARKRAPRKTAVKAAAEVESTAADALAPTALRDEAESVAQEPKAKPARKTRAKKAPEVDVAAVADVADVAEVTQVAEVAMAAVPLVQTPEPEGASAEIGALTQEQTHAPVQTEKRRGQRGEPRAANRGKQVPISDEPVEALAFGDIIAGVLDVEESPDAPGFPKRVLPPQPELPKLHKVLAQAGLGSRLEMERMIADGAISVNNQPAHVGQRIQWGDKVRVKGKLLRLNIAPPMPRVLAYHKPAGEVVTHDDPQNRPTVFRRLPRLQQGKWQSVGRLDLNTEGLLLLTSSGELANAMMHPSFGLEREYAARVLGALTAEEKEQLLAGIELEDGPAQFGSISDGGGEGANQWYQVTINEGRNREVRRMFETLGHAVSRLIRIRYGVVQLPRGLRRGFYMELGEYDVKALMEAAGMSTHERKGPLTRIDPKREQARSRGLRRAQPRPEDMEQDFSADDADGWDGYDEQAPQENPNQSAGQEHSGHQGQAEDGQEPRFRRTPFGRKRPAGSQGKGQRRDQRQGQGQGGQGGQGGSRQDGGRDSPREQREPRDQRQPGPQRDRRDPRDNRDNRDTRMQQGQARRHDADDEYSQRGVSHERPFEAKASRKRIFSSGNQVPDIIKAQRSGAGAGGGQRSGGGQGGIDPMRTSLGFIGGDSYRSGNKRGSGSAFGSQRNSGGGGGFGGQRSGGSGDSGGGFGGNRSGGGQRGGGQRGGSGGGGFGGQRGGGRGRSGR